MKLIDIKANETGKVFIFSLMLGIRTAGCTIGWTAVQAILMKRLGVESLPYSFIFFAIIGMAGSFIYLLFADLISRGTLLKIFCGLTALILIIAGLVIPDSHSNVMTAGFIISCVLVIMGNSIGYSTTGIQIWTIINDTFRPGEGTRLYPIIATAPLIGSITGGALTPFIVDNLGMKSLIIIWGLSMLSVLPLMDILRKYYGKEILARASYLKILKKSSRNMFLNFKEGFLFSLRSPFVHALSVICILFWTVASLKEFQYGIIMNNNFSTEEELSKFFASFTVYLHIVVLIFQLLFTGRIIKLTGTGYGFIILPVTIFSGLLAIMLSFSFQTGVGMRFIWDLSAMTVQGSVFQLAFNGVYGPYRGRVRGLLEGFINPVGGIAGGLLIIFINYFLYNNTETKGGSGEEVLITIIGLFFSLLWIKAAFLLKRQYNKITIKNLESEDRRTFLDAIEMAGELKKSLVMEKFEEILKRDDPEAKETVYKTMELYGYEKHREYNIQ